MPALANYRVWPQALKGVKDLTLAVHVQQHAVVQRMKAGLSGNAAWTPDCQPLQAATAHWSILQCSTPGNHLDMHTA